MKRLINWFEIPVHDFGRAVKFYQDLLNIKINAYGDEKEKMGFFPKDETGLEGAISYSSGFKPSSDGVLLNFYQEQDLQFFLNEVERLGGQVVRPKTKIEAEGRGYFALFKDTEGNRLGVYSEE